MRFLLTLFLVVHQFYASTQCFQIVDEKSDPVQFALVRVNYDEGQSEILETDEKGELCIELEGFHSAELMIRASGFIDTTLRITVEQPKLLIRLRAIQQEFESVTVTGNYSAIEAKQNPIQVLTIDRAKIEAMGAQNLEDALSNSLNIQMSKDPVLGTQLRMLGMDGNKVKVMVDGVPIVGRLDGQLDLSQILMNDVERIEIVKGPMSVDYGTDALAGTINIITKVSRRTSVGVSSQYESSGTYATNMQSSWTKKRSQLSIHGSRQFFDGFRLSDEPFHIERKSIADSSRYQLAKPKEQFAYSVKWRKLPKQGASRLITTLTFNGYQDAIYNLGLPRKPYALSAFDEHYRTRRLDGSAQLNGRLKSGDALQLMMGYNQFERKKNTYYRDLTNLSSELTSADSDQDTAVFEAFHSRGTYTFKNDSARVNWTVGYDGFYHQTTGERIENQRAERFQVAGFTVLEWRIYSKLHLRTGLRAGIQTTYKSPVMPSMAVLYEPNSFNRFRIQWSKGFRAPSLKEMYLHFVDANHQIYGNPALLPETSNFASIQFERSGQNRFKDVLIEFSATGMHLRNGIQLALAEDNLVYAYLNVAQMKLFSAESKLSIKKPKWSVQLSVVENLKQYVLEGANNPSWLDFAEVSGQFQWKVLKRTSLHVFAKRTGLEPQIIQDDHEVNLIQRSAYTMVNASLAQSFFQDRFTMNVGVKNLLNVSTINRAGNAQAHTVSDQLFVGYGRVYFIRLSLTLNSRKSK